MRTMMMMGTGMGRARITTEGRGELLVMVRDNETELAIRMVRSRQWIYAAASDVGGRFGRGAPVLLLLLLVFVLVAETQTLASRLVLRPIGWRGSPFEGVAAVTVLRRLRDVAEMRKDTVKS